MHLGELELSLGAYTLRERSISDYVSERLSREDCQLAGTASRCGRRRGVPFGLVFCVDLSLRVVANVTDVDIAADIELLGAELGHGGDGGGLQLLKNAMSAEVEMRM